ncbi:MAG: hydantoinase/oxoprolinase family protein [Hyphomicrobiaceae bacterium]
MRMIGVDVGGTFTDSVFYDDASHELRWAKAPSSPAKPAEGVLAALKRHGIPLDSVDRFVHGVTIGTNAILERKGAAVWMITTKGFTDTIEIARTNRTVLYNIKTLKPTPLVDRRRIFGVDERVLANGTVLRPLQPGELAGVMEKLKQIPPSALVVCFLHSYANDKHEKAAVEALRNALPDWFICSSAEIVPEMREYERFNTAVMNGYIGPVMDRYLAGLNTTLRSEGYRGPVFIMISNGGIITAKRAARFPVQTVLSGPAGGVAAALHLGELLGLKNLITYDMGGTSTDVCLINNGNVSTTSDQVIEGYAIRTPQIDISTIGAGGGSIAWVDAGNILKVGPISAGAVPGPACYGQGGTEPTVTDANLVLRRLSPYLKLAGSVALDDALAHEAVSRIVRKVAGLDIPAAAEGIIRIAIARMVSAIKETSIDRGHDPRDFVLLAYGGAGPMHAAFVAEELEMSQVLVPPRPGNFSAFGALISDIRHDHVRSRRFGLDATIKEAIETEFVEMEKNAVATMAGEGLPKASIVLQRACGMRYAGQSWDLPVRLPDAIPAHDGLEELFHSAHEQRYGYRLSDRIEIVTLRVTAIGKIEKPSLSRLAVRTPVDVARREIRSVRFQGRECATPIYDRDLLPGSAQLAGPAVVEEMGSVTVVPPGWVLYVGSLGEFLLRREAR